VGFASKEAADYCADYVADNSGMPDPQSEGDSITKQASLELCNALITASNEIRTKTGSYSDTFNKTAAAADPVAVANSDAWAIMQKCAAETGSLIQGGDKPNDEPAAAQNNAEAALDNHLRPQNYANLGERGVGGYERKGQGHVGTEEKHPIAPRATEGGTNSLIENSSKHGSMEMPPPAGLGGGAPGGAPEGLGGGAPGGMPTEGMTGGDQGLDPQVLQGIEIGLRLAAENPEQAAQLLAAHDAEAGGAPGAEAGGPVPPPHHAPEAEAPPPPHPGAEEPKQASFEEIVKKIASGTGTLIQGGDHPNTLSSAAAHNNEAAHEQKLRPEGYANMGERGVGNTAFKAPAGAIVGSEQKHPLAPKATGHGSNSVTEFGHKSAYDQLFEQAASQVVPYLPTGMADNQKVAHVRAAMGLNREEQADYLQTLYTNLGAEKTAAEGVKTHFLKAASAPKACGTCKKEKCVCAPSKQASVKSLSNLQAALSRLQHTAS
jgi:hypothetical protein